VKEWQEHALPMLQKVQDALPAFLGQLDRRCSCDVGRLLKEACSVHSGTCREQGVEVALDLGDSADGLWGLISRVDLMTVMENLLMGAYSRKDKKKEIAKDIETVLDHFPRLAEITTNFSNKPSKALNKC